MEPATATSGNACRAGVINARRGCLQRRSRRHGRHAQDHARDLPDAGARRSASPWCSAGRKSQAGMWMNPPAAIGSRYTRACSATWPMSRVTITPGITAFAMEVRKTERSGHDSAGKRSVRCREFAGVATDGAAARLRATEIPLANVRPAPKPVLARPRLLARLFEKGV